MKKRSIVSLTIGVMLAVSSVCTATVPADAVSISGIAPGDSVAAAKSAFGEPNVSGDKLYFSNGVTIEVDKRNSDIVEEIETKDGNMTTPGGAHVGMSEGTLESIYGHADKMEFEDNENEYTYYSEDKHKKMKFKVVNGVIVKIKCSLN